MEDELLIDYLEEASAFLRKKKERLMELRREYEDSYDKEAREEMDILRQEIKSKKSEIKDRLYESADELRHIKKYFPGFFEILLDDEEIGRILEKKDFLFDVKEAPANAAVQQFARIGNDRKQLKDAVGFLEKWHGSITEKQLTATYPALKGRIKGSLESSDAIEKIGELDKELKKEGWKIIVGNDQLIAQVAGMFIARLKKAEVEVQQARLNYESAKGRGSVNEYTALKMLKKAEGKKGRWEGMIKHLLLSNPKYLSSLKKKSGWLQRGKRSEIEKFAERVTARKVKERVWLDKMRKRLR